MFNIRLHSLQGVWAIAISLAGLSHPAWGASLTTNEGLSALDKDVETRLEPTATTLELSNDEIASTFNETITATNSIRDYAVAITSYEQPEVHLEQSNAFREIPEPNSILGILLLGGIGTGLMFKHRQRKTQK